MTDLLTVFLGFGIFNANCAARLIPSGRMIASRDGPCSGWVIFRKKFAAPLRCAPGLRRAERAECDSLSRP